MLRIHESKQGGENGEFFARNSESEKNERNDEVSKEYVQTRVRKRISQKKTYPDNIQAKV